MLTTLEFTKNFHLDAGIKKSSRDYPITHLATCALEKSKIFFPATPKKKMSQPKGLKKYSIIFNLESLFLLIL